MKNNISSLSTALGNHRTVLAAVAALMLGGCASTAIEENFASVQQLGRERLGSQVQWLTTEDARRQAQAEVERLLARPLGADDAVRIALAYSPALQAMLYDSAAASAAATQSARLPNPVFAFERLARGSGAERELEISRVLSFSVLDMLLLPSRMRMAGYQQEATRLTLAGNVVRAAAEARVAWVDAVAARQSLQYVMQVKQSADASAELARRMQAVGNFSRLQRAREQAFAADAVAQLARARYAVASTREVLVRVLGLNEAQAASLTLPDRLPELPDAPKDEASLAKAALDQRLDVRLARANLEFHARGQGLTRITSFVNGLEYGPARNGDTGLPAQRGYDIDLRLPIFDFGDAARSRAEATYMAMLQRTAQVAVEATSQLRENYGAYRSAYDIARHYRDEVVPLRKTIAEENVLRYNGMLIGVFELLADTREQIASVVQAIDAQRDFWLADAALQTTLIGQPTAALAVGTPVTPIGGRQGGH
jgi:outer membrane protein TolC